MPNSENTRSIHPIKRTFDIIISLFLLVALSPLFLVYLILIFIEHVFRGRPFDPLFYHETRMTADVPFELFKFNIFKYEKILEMRANKTFIHTKLLEKNGSLLKVGWTIKQVYMDELPQLWNVLIGDMSLVGPRPVNLEVYNDILKRGYTAKKKVRAGMTGYFQSFKNTAGVSSEKMDGEYAHYCFNNPWYKILLFDLKIILRTFKIIIRARGV